MIGNVLIGTIAAGNTLEAPLNPLFVEESNLYAILGLEAGKLSQSIARMYSIIGLEAGFQSVNNSRLYGIVGFEQTKQSISKTRLYVVLTE